ncbi:MAG TPA: ATP-grasp domain-containing protein [Trebonia sp.]|nr:ATP-grasp domain-containing protein [Trebonia sp.]
MIVHEENAVSPDRPALVVGYSRSLFLELARLLPAGSIVLLDEPEGARKGKVAEVAQDPGCRELIVEEYLRPGGADTFFLRHPGLRPALVVPAHDYAVPAAARLAERYGLPGAGFGAAQVLRDKELTRAVAAAAGIANPVSRPVASRADVAALWAQVGGPLILKPANRQGAIGTRVIRDRTEISEAWAECAADVAEAEYCLPERDLAPRMLAEQFISGQEFSVEMLYRAGERAFGNATAKVLYEGPRPVELGHHVPAPVPPALIATLLHETERLLAAAGFGTGMVHCEWIVSGGVPYLVECAGRLPGDFIAELISGVYEFDVLGAYAELLRGGDPRCPSEPVQAAVSWHGRAEPGLVAAIDGADEAAAIPGVRTCRVLVAPGQVIGPLRSSWDRAAVVTAYAPSPAQARRIAQDAINTIKVTTVPPALAAGA